MARCYPAEGALAYGPLAAWLRSEAIAGRLRRLDRGRLRELARLLPELLGESAIAPPEPLPEADQRRRLFDAAAAALTGAGPALLLVADDLHWCDRESLRFLHYLLRTAPDGRLLVAGTARREELGERHPLGGLVAELRARERCEEIELGRLRPAQTAALAERLAGRPLGRAEGERLHAATEGNPLFVIEALRAGWEPERGGPISPRLEAAIAARLDQLSDPARELAGLAATVGREFTAAVLNAAGEGGEEDLVRALDELWRRRLVREHAADAYDFSHGEIREVAYRALGPARRRSHHLRVAGALERLNADDPAAVAGQVARHYESAGAPREAVAWYERAAEAAQRLHASREAVRLLDRALELLRGLPETPDRPAHELALLAAMTAPLGSIEGYGSQRLDDLHERALGLAGGLGVEPPPPLLRSMAVASLSRSRLEDARRCGDRLAARGARDDDAVLAAEGAYVLGIAAFWSGELAAARRHFEAAVAACRPEHRATHLLHYGMDPEVLCRGRLALALWFLGRPEAAARARDATMALADGIGHPLTRGVALVFAWHLALELRDEERLRACAAALAAGRGDWVARHIELARAVSRGYVDVLDGHGRAGVARIERALEGTTGDDAPGMRSLLTRVLLEACATAKEPRAGLAAAEQALAVGVGARLWEAETRRLRAEFLAALGAPAEQIDGELERALAIARRQGALALELRVAASRLRLGTEGARADLAAVLERLPEGRESPEAREAAALLAS